MKAAEPLELFRDQEYTDMPITEFSESNISGDEVYDDEDTFGVTSNCADSHSEDNSIPSCSVEEDGEEGDLRPAKRIRCQRMIDEEIDSSPSSLSGDVTTALVVKAAGEEDEEGDEEEVQ